MKKTRALCMAIIAAILAAFSSVAALTSPPLRVLTINVWSGLDYEGTWSFGEYEDRARREKPDQGSRTRRRRSKRFLTL